MKRQEILFWLGVVVLLSLMYKFIEKSVLIASINQHLPPLEAGLLAGILLGDKGGLRGEFYQQLQRTGIVHLVVVSGTNVMLLGALLVENGAWLIGRKQAIVISASLLFWYAVMVGLEPPVLRAILLLGFYYGAQLAGRRIEVWRALVATVVLMAVIQIKMLWGVSFWLSLLAFGGVVTRPKVSRQPIINDLATTVWVSLWVTPVLAIVFGQISLVGPIVNALVLGLVEMITVGGVLGLIFWPVLWLIYPLLHYVVRLVEVMGSWPGAVITVRFNWWLLGGWYLILFFLLLKGQQRRV